MISRRGGNGIPCHLNRPSGKLVSDFNAIRHAVAEAALSQGAWLILNRVSVMKFKCRENAADAGFTQNETGSPAWHLDLRKRCCLRQITLHLLELFLIFTLVEQTLGTQSHDVFEFISQLPAASGAHGNASSFCDFCDHASQFLMKVTGECGIQSAIL
jgi:hypothetical protein